MIWPSICSGCGSIKTGCEGYCRRCRRFLKPVVLGRDGSRVAGPRGSECQWSFYVRSVLEVLAVLSVGAFRVTSGLWGLQGR